MDMPNPRLHTHISLVGNKLVLVGGISATSGEVSNVVDIYDLNTETWLPSQHLINARLPEHSAVIGSSLIISGRDLQVADVIDINTSVATTWNLSSFDSYKPVAVGTKVLFYSEYRSSEQVDIFDISTGFVSSTVQQSYQTAVTRGDKVHFFTSEDMDTYDSTNNVWTSVSIRRTLPDTTYQAYLILDKVYILTQMSIILFDVINVNWTVEMTHHYKFNSYTVLSDTTIFLPGGQIQDQSRTMLRYDAKTGNFFAWEHSDISFGSTYFANGVGWNGSLYLVGWSSIQDLQSETKVLKYDTLARHSLITTPTDAEFLVFQMIVRQNMLYATTISYVDTKTTVWIYDLIDNSWNQLIDIPGVMHIEMQSFDDILVLYNYVHQLTLTIFNITSNTFVSTMLPGGSSIPFIVVLNNQLLAFGDVRNEKLTDKLYVLDLNSFEWSTFNMSVGRTYYHTIHQDRVLISSSRNFEEFYVWSTHTKQLSTIPVPGKTSFYSFTRVNDWIFLAGGLDVSNESETMLSTVIIFDLNTDKIIKTMNLQAPRLGPLVSFVHPFVVFAGGRRSILPIFSPAIDIYNIETDQWIRLTMRLPAAVQIFTATTVGSMIWFGHDRYYAVLNLEESPRITQDFTDVPTVVSRHRSVVLGQNNIIFYGGSGSLRAFFSIRETTRNRDFGMVVPTTWNNFIVATNWNNVLLVSVPKGILKVELPTMNNNLADQDLFLNQQTNLFVNASGDRLQYQWSLNDIPLNETSPSIVVHGEKTRNGTYIVDVTDHCNVTMKQTIDIKVFGPPSFSSNLVNRMVVCSSPLVVDLGCRGRNCTMRWTVDDSNAIVHSTNDVHELSSQNFECNKRHQVCAIASNPSGELASCASVHVVDIASIFNGPTFVSRMLLYPGMSVDLTVDIIDSRCHNHSWYLVSLGSKEHLQNYYASSSVYTWDVKEIVMPNSTIIVEAFCENSILRSRGVPVKLSSIPGWGLALIIIGAAALIGGLIVTAIFVRRRFQRKHQQQVELESMLTEEKKQHVNIRDSVSEHSDWVADETFSFRPIEKLPLTVDTAKLGFGKKNEPVDIDIWTQGMVSISSKKTRNPLTTLKERLIEKGERVSIYIPISNKAAIRIEPNSFFVPDGSVVTVTLSVKMEVTTTLKTQMFVVLEDKKIFSTVNLSITSKPSQWIDLDDVQSASSLGYGG